MSQSQKIWIDLCHTPHVPFFLPIIRQLKSEGHEVQLTARDCFQTCSLLDLVGFKYQKIGKHFGKKKYAKIAGLILRTIQLWYYSLGKKFDLALSHGSPYQVVAAFFNKIPSVTFDDYENSNFVIFNYFATKIFMPEVIDDNILKTKNINLGKVEKYPGLKEDLYVADFHPDEYIYKELNINSGKIIVTVRPPATEAHYHNPESEKILLAVLQKIIKHPGTVVIFLPRSENHKKIVEDPALIDKNKILVPAKVLNGLNLIWHSDLVISGGGTMNREAATLGVPVYSIFKGPKGAVDSYLEKNGKLNFIDNEFDIDKIKIRKRKRELDSIQKNPKLIDYITKRVISLKTEMSKN
jgi:predicted glycosyltransferase